MGSLKETPGSLAPRERASQLVEGDFEADLTAALSSVRRSLVETLDELGAIPDSGKALARRLKLNRTLSWRLSKIVGDIEPFQAIQLLPGRSAFDGLIKN